MTKSPSLSTPSWLEPFGTDLDSPSQQRVTHAQIALASTRLLSEPIVAQRLISVGNVGLTLRDDDPQEGRDLEEWGHTFATAVATLLPPSPEASARTSRARRRWQEQLLTAQQRWPDLASLMPSAYLLCADHKPPEYGLAPQLYPAGRIADLLDWDGFAPLVKEMLLAVSPVAAPAWLAGRAGLPQALATIIAETFKNTHDHARTEVDGATVTTSIRGLFVRYYPMTQLVATITAIDPTHRTAAEKYAHSFVPPPPPTRTGFRVKEIKRVEGFLEISVLDSGPGMASRWRGENVTSLSSRDQGAAVVECLHKQRTTTGSDGRGFGLWKVLLSLAQLKGLISIRTNGVHLYRQFGFSTGYGGPLLPREQLYDWSRRLTTTPSPFPHVKGTVVSFLLPMADA
jgi:hypothetical protein